METYTQRDQQMFAAGAQYGMTIGYNYARGQATPANQSWRLL